MTADGANWTIAINTAANQHPITLPTSVPAGATIVIGILNRTDETTGITSVTGSLNGAYTLAEGPTDSTNSTYRSWVYYFVNSSAGTEEITVDFEGAGNISAQLVAGWCADDAGAQTFDVDAVSQHASAATQITSAAITAAGGGGMIGFAVCNNAVTWTADGSGETNIEGGSGGQRITAFFEAYASGGTKEFVATPSGATVTHFHVTGFLTPGAGAGSTAHLKTTRRLLLGVN